MKNQKLLNLLTEASNFKSGNIVNDKSNANYNI